MSAKLPLDEVMNYDLRFLSPGAYTAEELQAELERSQAVIAAHVMAGTGQGYWFERVREIERLRAARGPFEKEAR